VSRYSTPPMAPSELIALWQAHFPELAPTETHVYTSPRRQAQLRLDANFAAKDCGKWADELADKYGVARPVRVKP
jgi:hypothetical protein